MTLGMHLKSWPHIAHDALLTCDMLWLGVQGADEKVVTAKQEHELALKRMDKGQARQVCPPLQSSCDYMMMMMMTTTTMMRGGGGDVGVVDGLVL